MMDNKVITPDRTEGEIVCAGSRSYVEQAAGESAKRCPALLLFAGTTEGRELAEYLDRQKVSCHVCTATQYGARLLEGTTVHQIHSARLDAGEMEELMRQEGITHVVDATHPFAAEASENIRRASGKAGCAYFRLLRKTETDRTPGGDCETENNAKTCRNAYPGAVAFSSIREAVEYLAGTEGKIFVATGTKELAEYTRLKDYRERVYARILPALESVQAAVALGLQEKHLICMQGPFSEELNAAMLRETGARYMITKETGKTGGFPEKAAAARKAGAQLVVIGKPVQAEGYDAGEIRRILCREFSICPKREIAVIGIGMGAPENMTREAYEACARSDVVIGAQRMLDAVRELGKPSYASYLPAEIRKFLDDHPEYEKVAIVLSGDIGFYSGAGKLYDCLADEKVTLYCGIPSVVYLCAKLGVSWEDVQLMSLHGREQNLLAAVKENRKVFVLAGREASFRELCTALIQHGFAKVRLSVGCRLSYPDERILRGTALELADRNVGDLAAVLLENPEARKIVTHGIEDSAFLREQVPMTKSEVRSISLSKMKLESDSIAWDVGAGTGSVAVEMALRAVWGHVYAIEKKPEAAALIRKNCHKFAVTNMTVTEGTAPEALEALPAPTHVFIGGSSGNLKAILRVILKKNPQARIVMNAITLETLSEVLDCVRMAESSDTEIVSVSVAKAKEAGTYHMMMAQNPVYIVSFTGSGREMAFQEEPGKGLSFDRVL